MQISRNSVSSGRASRPRSPFGRRATGGQRLRRAARRRRPVRQPTEGDVCSSRARSGGEQHRAVRRPAPRRRRGARNCRGRAAARGSVARLPAGRASSPSRPLAARGPGRSPAAELRLGDRGEVDERRPVGEPRPSSWPSSTASRVLPMPPGPSNVTSRVAGSSRRSPSSATQTSRPIVAVWGRGTRRCRARRSGSGSSAGSWARICRSSSRSAADGSSPSSSTSSTLPSR